MFNDFVGAVCFAAAILTVVFAVVWTFTDAAVVEASMPPMPRFERVAR